MILLSKCNDNNRTRDIFHNILVDLNHWCSQSGSIISSDKSKHLHICKKRNCPNFDIYLFSFKIQNVNSLTILGISFDNKFSFKDHCLSLKKKLATRLNIIRFLSSRNSFIHLNTLILITRSIILSKIDYGLAVYGKCAKSTLNIIKPTYHSAIRTSLKAFTTTPTKNILTESGLPSIDHRRDLLTARLAPKICQSYRSPIIEDAKKILHRKKPPKFPSAIYIALNDSSKIGISPTISTLTPGNIPPWEFPTNIVNTTLATFKKNSTTKECYTQMFYEMTDEYRNDSWDFFYTDGSKSDTGTGLAIVSEAGNILYSARLPNYFSIYSTEAFAILKATEIANTIPKNIVICSDSLSTLKAINRIQNCSSTITKIRNNLLKSRQKIVLLWVPGHSGIKGNELADGAARTASEQLNILSIPPTKKDFLNVINTYWNNIRIDEWKTYVHHYSTINPKGESSAYPTETTTIMNKCFLRLRLGHTQSTHGHLLKKENPASCHLCQTNQILSIKHLTSECSKVNYVCKSLFKKKLTDLLSTTSIENIKNVYTLLLTLKLNTII